MDKTEFTNAVEVYQNMVYRTALHSLGSAADAEDAVQEVFLRLYNFRGSFESMEHLRRWLLRVTVNFCRDVLRSPWRKRRASLDEAPDTPVFQRPEESALYQEVMALPEKYRTVLYLFYYEELTVREIAELLKIRESSVTTRLFRAREKLKDRLGEDWQDE